MFLPVAAGRCAKAIKGRHAMVPQWQSVVCALCAQIIPAEWRPQL